MTNKFKAQETYSTRMKNQGMVKTTVWVPKDKAAEIKDCASLMRDKEWVDLTPEERPKRPAKSA